MRLILKKKITIKAESLSSCSVCLFWGFRVTREFFTHFPYYRWRATHFDLYSALRTSEQWGFFNMSHLLWHGPTLDNGHLRGPVAERLAVELSLTVLSRPGIQPRSHACDANGLPLCHCGSRPVLQTFFRE